MFCHSFQPFGIRVSELRMVELLEDLCDAMKSYTWGFANINDGGTLKQGWVKKEQAMDISLGMSKGEEQTKQKQLQSYCGRLIEDHEEEIIEAIQKESFDEERGEFL